MTVQEIFNAVEVREVEIEILSIIEENDRRWCSDNAYVETVKHLLSVRKHVLDSKFVMDESYKSLLSDFNEALIAQATEMRKRVIELHNASINCGTECDIETTGKCFRLQILFDTSCADHEGKENLEYSQWLLRRVHASVLQWCM